MGYVTESVASCAAGRSKIQFSRVTQLHPQTISTKGSAADMILHSLKHLEE